MSSRRLSSFQSSARKRSFSTAATANSTSTSSNDVPTYEGMSTAVLREECKKKNLPHSGRKSELVHRLQNCIRDESQDVVCNNVLRDKVPDASFPSPRDVENQLATPRIFPPSVINDPRLTERRRKREARAKKKQRLSGMKREDMKLSDIIENTSTGKESKSKIEARERRKRMKERQRLAEEGGKTESEKVEPPPQVPEESYEPEQTEEADEVGNAPQITIVNGKAVVSKPRTRIQHEKFSYDSYKRIDGRDRTSYSQRAHTQRQYCRKWTSEETELFFAGLGRFGMNFDKIAHLFPDRDHKQIKNKYKREDKSNNRMVDSALKKKLKFSEDVLRTLEDHIKLRKEAAERYILSKKTSDSVSSGVVPPSSGRINPIFPNISTEVDSNKESEDKKDSNEDGKATTEENLPVSVENQSAGENSEGLRAVTGIVEDEPYRYEDDDGDDHIPKENRETEVTEGSENNDSAVEQFDDLEDEEFPDDFEDPDDYEGDF